jgi:prophage regulatory protein
MRSHLRQSGGVDPSTAHAVARRLVEARSSAPSPPTTPQLPLPEIGFLRQRQVLMLIPFSKSTLWQRVRDRTFPQPIKLSPHMTVWRAEELRQWMAQQGEHGS